MAVLDERAFPSVKTRYVVQPDYWPGLIITGVFDKACLNAKKIIQQKKSFVNHFSIVFYGAPTGRSRWGAPFNNATPACAQRS